MSSASIGTAVSPSGPDPAQANITASTPAAGTTVTRELRAGYHVSGLAAATALYLQISRVAGLESARPAAAEEEEVTC